MLDMNAVASAVGTQRDLFSHISLPCTSCFCPSTQEQCWTEQLQPAYVNPNLLFHILSGRAFREDSYLSGKVLFCILL